MKRQPTTQQVTWFLDLERVASLALAKINAAATVHTDGHKSYTILKQHVDRHHVTISNDPKRTSKLFPWVHTTISNAKRVIIGIHHSFHSQYTNSAGILIRRYDQKNQLELLLHIGLQYRWC